MTIERMSLEEEEKYSIDWKKTLSYNIPWVLMLIVWTGLSLTILNQQSSFKEEGFRLMYLAFGIYFMASTIKWVGKPEVFMKYQCGRMGWLT
jgi:hypothetical protein